MFGNLIENLHGTVWKNWAGNVHASPLAIHEPKNEEELQQVLAAAQQEGKRIKVLGSGHSFTPIAASDEYMLSLRRMQGLISIDREAMQVEVYAGTTIQNLGELLAKEGLAQENLGDIDVQSIAGACSTGTHGTGIAFGTLATQIRGFRILAASGEYLDCSELENPEVFAAGRIGLGALGIITRVRLQVRKAYKLELQSQKARLDEVLERVEEYKQNYRNFEFFWMPYTNTVQLKLSQETEAEVDDPAWKKAVNNFLENKVLSLLCRFGRRFPSRYRLVNRLIAWGIGKGRKVNYSHRVFASVREVKFKEMEYNIPAEHFVDVLQKLRELMEQAEYPVFFPIECRWVKGDDIWLSPAYGRNSAYIALHVFEGREHEAYFAAAEKLFKAYGGRPHWGKMHQRKAKDLALAYPKWQDFLALRQRLDPQGYWLNPHLQELFALHEELAPR